MPIGLYCTTSNTRARALTMVAVAVVALTLTTAALSSSLRFTSSSLPLLTIIMLITTAVSPIYSFHLPKSIKTTKRSTSTTLGTGLVVGTQGAATNNTQQSHCRRHRKLQLLHPRNSHSLFSSANGNDDDDDDDDDDTYWGLEDEVQDPTQFSSTSSSTDPRLAALRSILESSWNVSTMGNVPTTPHQAAIAAVNCISNAIQSSNNNNILMVDVRLPSYDITEGSKYYDPCAIYDLASFMAEEMQQKKLVNKCLILVRNENERVQIVNNRQNFPRMTKTTTTKTTTPKAATEEEESDTDIEWELSDGTISDNVDDFRKKLMSSWTSTDNIINNNKSEEDDNNNNNSGNVVKMSSSKKQPPSPLSSPQSERKLFDNTSNFSSSSVSHRLWSMIGNEDLDDRNDYDGTFHRIISAVDSNAQLFDDEDAIILLSPYTTNDLIALRRILQRYCGGGGSTTRISSKTVILVNSRLEVLPREMDSALLVYGILPLVARSKQQQQQQQQPSMNRREESPGLKAVVMKRYPNDWTVHVDAYGDGFVEATRNSIGMTPLITDDKQFPSPEWIAMRVQAHVEGLTKEDGGGR